MPTPTREMVRDAAKELEDFAAECEDVSDKLLAVYAEWPADAQERRRALEYELSDAEKRLNVVKLLLAGIPPRDR